MEHEDELAEQDVDNAVVIPLFAKYSCDVDQEEEDGSCKRGVREVVKPKLDMQDGVEVEKDSKSTSGKAS